MGALIDLTKGQQSEHLSHALKAIRDGYVIAAPLEHSYVFLADAFNHDAVRTMHAMRKDPLGVAAQVLIGSVNTLNGIARDIHSDALTAIEKFWPGLLTLNLSPQLGLNWDLGDDRRLEKISVRIPSHGFVLELLQQSGPLAAASAGQAGEGPLTDHRKISVREIDLAATYSKGVLSDGPLTTVINVSQDGIEILRESAISKELLFKDQG